MSRAADRLAHLGRAMQQQDRGVHPDSGEKKMKNADTPAMPSMLKAGDMALSEGGLTKREYFAGIAMGRVIAQDKNGVMGPDITAAAAVILADALLVELDKEAT